MTVGGSQRDPAAETEGRKDNTRASETGPDRYIDNMRDGSLYTHPLVSIACVASMFVCHLHINNIQD